MENKILVLYIGVAGIRSEDIDTFINKVASRVVPDTFKGEIIIFPSQSTDSRIECINPKYITNKELVKEHSESMVRLIKELNNQRNLLKKEINE